MTNHMNYLTFDNYMAAVNVCLNAAAGVTADDIEDYAYADAFDDDETAFRTARRALRNAGF